MGASDFGREQRLSLCVDLVLGGIIKVQVRDS
jgi:hypothetical protein